MKILDYVATSTYAWVAPVFFSVFILGAIMIGFIHGTKTATYFGIFNLFGFIATTVVIAFTFGKLTSLIPGDIALGGKTIPIGTILNSAKDTIKSFVMTIATIAAYAIFLFLSIVIYFFFRKKLKKGIKEQTFKESIWNRVGGGSITLIYMLPVIMTLTSFFTIFSNQTFFTDMTSTFTKGVTANQITDLRTKSISMYKTVKSVQEVMGVTSTLKDIFNAASNQRGEAALDSILENDTTREALKFLLTDDFVSQNMDVVSTLDSGAFDGMTNDKLLNIQYKATGTPIAATTEEFAKVKSAVAKLMNSGKGSKVDPANVGAFLKKIGLFK